MSKELIERLLEIDGPADWVNTAQVAAYHIETQQKLIEGMNSLCAFNERTMDEMLARLAASQAQIKVLRDCIRTVFDDVLMRDELYEMCEKALAKPTDDSALQAAIAEGNKCKLCGTDMPNEHAYGCFADSARSTK